ncbi:MAG: sugar phosphate nucleotidyltransferase [Bacteroidota bacterium]|nr:sugar phosphate nucleotidyltransferase [Bacteroidota bacterium]
MKPTLLVLAAGMGSRYGGLKQVDKIGPSGETIVDYSVYDAVRAGFKKVVFIIRKDIEDAFREVYHENLSKHIEVEYVYQELENVPEGINVPKERVKPWGTCHAVMMGKEKINEPFAVINADDFYGADALQKMHDFLVTLDDSKQDSYCMVAYQLDKTLSDNGYVSRGVCKTDENSFLIDVKEHTHIEKKNGNIIFEDEDGSEKTLTGKEIVSMNMWGFNTSFFDYSEQQFKDFIKEHYNELKSEFYIPSVANKLITDGTVKLKVLETDSLWCGVTYKEDKPVVIDTVKKLVKESVYPEKLWK